MDASKGLVRAAQQLLADTVEAGCTRLELAALELEEERLRLARLFMGAAMALFLLFAGVLLAVAWLVMSVPSEWRLAALGTLALAFLAGSAAVIWRCRRLASTRAPLLQATLAELRRDAQSLSGAGAH